MDEEYVESLSAGCVYKQKLWDYSPDTIIIPSVRGWKTHIDDVAKVRHVKEYDKRFVVLACRETVNLPLFIMLTFYADVTESKILSHVEKRSCKKGKFYGQNYLTRNYTIATIEGPIQIFRFKSNYAHSKQYSITLTELYDITLMQKPLRTPFTPDSISNSLQEFDPDICLYCKIEGDSTIYYISHIILLFTCIRCIVIILDKRLVPKYILD